MVATNCFQESIDFVREVGQSPVHPQCLLAHQDELLPACPTPLSISQLYMTASALTGIKVDDSRFLLQSNAADFDQHVFSRRRIEPQAGETSAPVFVAAQIE